MKYYNILGALTLLIVLVACQKEPRYVDSYIISKDGKYGLIDSLGTEIVKPRFQFIEPIQKDGVALAIIDTIYASVRDSSFLGDRNIPVLNIKYGYITNEDKFLFSKPSYAKIKINSYLDSITAYSNFCQNFSFYGGLAAVQDTLTMKFGYIGLDGDTIISAQFHSVKRFNQGRAAVQLDYAVGQKNSGKWGLIDPTGKHVCDFVFTNIESPINNRSLAGIVIVDREKGGTIEGELSKDENGKVYVDKSKAQTIGESDSPTFSSKTFLVDENGKVVNDNLNMMYQYSNFSKDGIAVAIPNGIGQFLGAGYGFINKDGEFIKPIDVNNLSEEQAKRIVESKYFLNELLPADIEFADATRFTDGYAAVNLGRAWIYVDKELIPRGNEEYPIYEDALPFSHGLAGVKLDGKFGYINKDFQLVIPCKYDSCAIAGKNLCRVYSGDRTENGFSIISYINRQNNVVWQNVVYNSNYFNEKSDTPTIGKWRDFDYVYMGKNYTIVWILIGLGVLLFTIIFFARLHNRRRKVIKDNCEHISNSAPQQASIQKIDEEQGIEIEQSIDTIESKVNDNDKKENQILEKDKLLKQSIENRINDILN